MRGKTYWLHAARGLALAIALCGVIVSAKAASIFYPAQGPIPPGYSFTNIVESSGTDLVPLYGPPTPVLIGLDFTPLPAFQASSAGGGADLTDGQLNYTVMAGPGAGGIPLITFSEGGTYALGGVGPATSALAGAIMRVSILELNGAPIAPINLAPSSASASFSLPANLGTGPWGLSVSVNLAVQLAGLGYGPGQVATKADVVINNALVAVSTPTSNAQINKRDFGVTIMPEPATAGLMGLALCGLVAVRRPSRRD